MKLGFLINSYGRGGAQKVISLVSSRLQSVPQVLIQYQGELAYPYLGEVIELDRKGGIISRTQVGRLVGRVISLWRVLSNQKVTVLVSFLVRTNILAALVKKLRLYKGVLILNEVTVPSRHKSYSQLQKWLLKHAYTWADKIIVPSSGIRGDLVSNFGLSDNVIRVIPNPIDGEAIRKAMSQEYGFGNLPQVGLRVVAVGRLTASKRFDALIHAVFRARNSVDVQLVIIGDGEEKHNLINLACDLGMTPNIHWAGWVDNPFSIMVQCDMFVLSSLYEGFGNVIVEAMCCGLPVISYDCPTGPRDIIGESEHGVLVENGDVAGLSAAIVRMARDDEYRARYRQKALERAKDYEIEQVVLMWKAELNDV